MKKALRRIADRLSLALVQTAVFDRLVRYLSYQRKRVFRRKIEARLYESGAYGDEVMAGPFKGMRYPAPEHWASCRFEKIIGCYECELNDSIERLIQSGKKYSEVVVVGAAEGYYAAGFGTVLPEAKIYAYEPHPQRVSVMGELARVNSVDSRLTIGGLCTPETLAAVPVGEAPLVVCDVDGYEEKLMDPDAVPWLKTADIILELHDFIVPNISDTVRDRFEASHDIEVVRVSSVDYEKYPILQDLPMPEIQAMTDSDRPYIHNWFVMTPRGG